MAALHPSPYYAIFEATFDKGRSTIVARFESKASYLAEVNTNLMYNIYTFVKKEVADKTLQPANDNEPVPNVLCVMRLDVTDHGPALPYFHQAEQIGNKFIRTEREIDWYAGDGK